jgi:chemotaxis protein MotB
MASTDNEVPAPIIVKKIIKGGHGHHGGAWKVAYADFVTAMMAFFLLMWLLNVTTEEQKNALSNYFDPTHPRVSSELSGSGGILGGMTMSPDGAQVSNVQSIATPKSRVTPRSGMAKGDQTDQKGTSEHEGDTFDPTLEGRVASDTDKGAKDDGENNLQDGFNVLNEMEKLEQQDLEQMKAIVEEFENTNFEEIKEQIIKEVEKAPELADLMDNLMIDITPEGLRIQIIDSEGRSMFPSGKAAMHGFMRELVSKVTQVIVPQTNQISVRGHTDGKPYPDGAAYNNWNLSSDRALASQRAMIESGLGQPRVENVVGRADREHFLPDEPLSPRNRRISIVLLREKLENTDEIKQKAAEVVKKIQEKAAAQRELEEDREDAPQFEQVIDGNSAAFTIEDSQTPQTKHDDTKVDVGNEIKKVRDNARHGNTPAPRIIELPAPSEPTRNNNTQVLDFP